MVSSILICCSVTWGDSVVPYPPPLPVTLDSVVRLLQRTVFDLPFVMMSFMTLKTGLQLAIPQMKGDISTRVIRSAALSLGFRIGMPGLRETPLVRSVLSWASIYVDAVISIGKVMRLIWRPVLC